MLAFCRVSAAFKNDSMTIGPLLNRGQSVYQILRNHPEITVTAKTLYTYIESGVFKDYGIDSFSLRRKVGMKPRKRLKERRHPACYDGHRYEDYLEFTGDNPAVCTTEMDTVYNDPEGPYIQTFIFQNTAFMIGVLHSKKTSESMPAKPLSCIIVPGRQPMFFATAGAKAFVPSFTIPT